MNPYYQDEAVTIYHGDCREIAPTLGHFDLLLTDPPYGLGSDSHATRLGGLHRRNASAPGSQYINYGWDSAPPSRAEIELLIQQATLHIIWGANHIGNFPPSPCWLVWDKLNGENRYADCELAWTSLKIAVRRKAHLWHGMLRHDNEPREHPTQKPLPLFMWCINLAGEPVRTVLDPFAGSGTAGRAAKDLGKQAVLIEREESYCEIAARRMAQEVLPLAPAAMESREPELLPI